jgi:hypothetical protein
MAGNPVLGTSRVEGFLQLYRDFTNTAKLQTSPEELRLRGSTSEPVRTVGTCHLICQTCLTTRRKITNLENEIALLKQSIPVKLRTPDNSGEFQDDNEEFSLRMRSSSFSSPPAKRLKHTVDVPSPRLRDFVAEGLVSVEQAEFFFGAFFQGCDRYVPIFDPSHDTFTSIRARSALLFDAIITIGCGVLSNADSQICSQLNFHLRKVLNLAILKPDLASLETVQALLVVACYVPERSLLLAFATRMALDLRLPTAFEKLTRSLVRQRSGASDSDTLQSQTVLMRHSRAWFQLVILEQILHIDAGNLQTRSSQLNNDARRCRILLHKPFANILDVRLLSQVELNTLRGKVHDVLSQKEDFNEDELIGILGDVQVDIDVWYSDWRNVVQSMPCEETPVLWAKCAFCFLLLLKLTLILPDTDNHSKRRLLDDGKRLLRELNKAAGGLTSGGRTKTSQMYLQVLQQSVRKYETATQGDQHRSLSMDDQISIDQATDSPTSFFWSGNGPINDIDKFVPEQFVFEWDFPGLTFSAGTASNNDTFFDDLFDSNGIGDIFFSTLPAPGPLQF